MGLMMDYLMALTNLIIYTVSQDTPVHRDNERNYGLFLSYDVSFIYPHLPTVAVSNILAFFF